MKPLILALLLSTAFATINQRIVTEVSYHKLVNGNRGISLLAKTSIRVNDSVVIKLGASETYTGARGASLMAVNHNLLRVDVGVYWILAKDFQVGYTHSERNLIEGATYTDVFPFKSVDILSVRKEFDLGF